MASENWEQEKINYLKYSNEESHKLVKESIEEALILLMKEKNFDDISITEIVKRAGVSRTAFYKNYKSKENVLSSFIDRKTEEIISHTQGPGDFDNFNFWVNIFEAVKLYADDYKLICDSGQKALLSESLNQFALKFMDVPDQKNEYFLVFYAGGFSNVILRWVNNGMQEPPTEMARILKEK